MEDGLFVILPDGKLTVLSFPCLGFITISIEVFINSPEYKNPNIDQFILAVLLDKNKSAIFLHQLTYNFTFTNIMGCQNKK